MEQNTSLPLLHDARAGHTVHNSFELEAIFSNTFYASMKTRLIGGVDEPLYLPVGANNNETNDSLLQYRADYYASALHEVAHWCIAGKQRLKYVDFGYWYIPDGRNKEQQAKFEQVESKSQALEWLFSIAARYTFNVSLDNLSLNEIGLTEHGSQVNIYISCSVLEKKFKKAVYDQAVYFVESGIPVRAEQFILALSKFYQTDISTAFFLNALMLEAKY